MEAGDDVPLLDSSLGGDRSTSGCCKVSRYVGPYYKCIEVTTALMFLGLSSTMPVVNQLVYHLAALEVGAESGNDITPGSEQGTAGQPVDCGGNTSRQGDHMEDLVEERAATWSLYMKVASTCPAIFSTLVILSLSDLTGRKLGLVLSLFGSLLCTIIYMFTFYLKLSPAMLVFGSFIDGLFGSMLCLLGLSFAYVADTSKPHMRTVRFVILEGISSLTVSLAQIGMGYVIRMCGYGIGLWIPVAITSVNFFFTIIFIQDSFPPVVNNQPPVQLRRQSSVEVAKVELMRAVKSITIFFQTHETQWLRGKLLLLLLAFVLTVTVSMGEMTIRTLFLMTTPFCFNSVAIGYVNAVTFFFHGMVGMLLVVLLKRCLSDSVIAIISAVSSTLVRFTFGLASNYVLLGISIVVGCVSSLIYPMIRALMSALVLPDQQGTLFAAVFSLETVGDLLSGVIINALYAATVHIMPGIAFIFIGFVMVGVTVLLSVHLYLERRYPHANMALDPQVASSRREGRDYDKEGDRRCIEDVDDHVVNASRDSLDVNTTGSDTIHDVDD